MKKTIWNKILACIFIIIPIGSIANAQNNSTRSPYSRYALGELINNRSTATKSMGGVGIGIRNPFIVNSTNPASYTSVDSMTFILDMGVSAGYSFLAQGDKKDDRMLGNLDYISVLFPVTRYLGVSAGIHPLASRGYLFGSDQDNHGSVSDPAKYRSLFTGSGNVNELYLGISGVVYKGFSLGVNTNFIFGDESRWRQINFLLPDAYNPIFRDEISIRGFKADLGLQYENRWGYDNESFFVLGATFSPKAILKAESKSIDVVSNSSSGTTSLGKTDELRIDKYDTSLPMQFGLGGSLSLNNIWMVAADVNYQKWSDVSFKDLVKTRDVIGWSIGSEWTPDPRSRSLFAQSSYRIGFNGSNSYFTFPINGVQESFYNLGTSLGIGIPLVDRRSRLNISFDYKYLLPSNSNMVKEQYLGISIGIMFNGNWFGKAQVD